MHATIRTIDNADPGTGTLCAAAVMSSDTARHAVTASLPDGTVHVATWGSSNTEPAIGATALLMGHHGAVS